MAYNIGKAQIIGIDGSIQFVGYASIIGGAILNNVNFTDDFSLDWLKNSDGNTVGALTCDRKISVDIAFVPVGGTLFDTTYAAATTTIPIDRLAKIRLYSFANYYNGYYNYIGGQRLSLTNTGRAVVVLPLVSFVDGMNAIDLSIITART